MMPSEHRGFVEKRVWYKVKWARNPYNEKEDWKNIEGKFDLMTEEDLEKFKDFITIIRSAAVPKCETGLSLRFGATSEEDIDNWIKKHGA